MPILYGHSISLVGDLLVCFLFIDKLIDDLIFGQQKKEEEEEEEVRGKCVPKEVEALT